MDPIERDVKYRRLLAMCVRVCRDDLILIKLDRLGKRIIVLV